MSLAAGGTSGAARTIQARPSRPRRRDRDRRDSRRPCNRLRRARGPLQRRSRTLPGPRPAPPGSRRPSSLPSGCGPMPALRRPDRGGRRDATPDPRLAAVAALRANLVNDRDETRWHRRDRGCNRRQERQQQERSGRHGRVIRCHQSWNRSSSESIFGTPQSLACSSNTFRGTATRMVVTSQSGWGTKPVE